MKPSKFPIETPRNLATDNLIQFLSSEQAIEDAASFIVQMKCKYQIPSTSKWIVFGASYGASLATWTRQRHPELVHAAVASSGPLWAKPDFWEYFQVVEASLRNGNCRAAIAEAFGEISMELLTHNGQQLLNEKLLYAAQHILCIGNTTLRTLIILGSAIQFRQRFGVTMISRICSRIWPPRSRWLYNTTVPRRSLTLNRCARLW